MYVQEWSALFEGWWASDEGSMILIIFPPSGDLATWLPAWRPLNSRTGLGIPRVCTRRTVLLSR